jgi:hypothetical protein
MVGSAVAGSPPEGKPNHASSERPCAYRKSHRRQRPAPDAERRLVDEILRDATPMGHRSTRVAHVLLE